jgi:hypothetical protein
MTIVVTLKRSMTMTVKTSVLRKVAHIMRIKTTGRGQQSREVFATRQSTEEKAEGSNAKYNQTIIEFEKQKAKFLVEAIKNLQPENKDLLSFRSLLPHVDNIPAHMKVSFINRIQQLLISFPILQPLQHSSPTHFHCRRRRLQPHILTVCHQELPGRLLCFRIPLKTTRFTSKCHPSAAHSYATTR